jgi:hypothetical protein
VEFMGVSVGVLALICALVLLFGVRGTRRILGWSFGLLLLGAAGVVALVWVWPTLQHGATQAAETADTPAAIPVRILPALPPGFVLENPPADKIRITGPDKQIFEFSAGTKEAAINSYMEAQYGAPGTARAECWAKEPGPWCDFRSAR